MNNIEKRPQVLNSVTPTESAQRLRVEEAVQVAGGIEKLKAVGFFSFTGIDPEIQERNTPIIYRELAEVAFDRIIELRKKLKVLSEKIPCLRQTRLGDC